MSDLLYDLCVPRVKKMKCRDLDAFASVIRQLNDMPTVDRRLFIDKLATAQTTTRRQKMPEAGHPTRSPGNRGKWKSGVKRMYRGREVLGEGVEWM